MDGASWVLAGATSFVGAHFALSHSLRRPLVARLGENGFSGIYSLVAAATLGATVWAYRAAPITEPLWSVGDGLWALATVAMLVASILLMGSLIRNPALPGAIIFLSLVGAIMQDRKKAELDPQTWSAWQNRTSYLPFAAIVQGRAGFGSLGFHAILGGIVVWLAATCAHIPLAGWPAGIWCWVG